VVKISILAAIVLFFFLRLLKKKSSFIARGLVRLGGYILISVLAVWGLKAIGPTQYIAYSDSFSVFKSAGKPLVIGWQRFSYLPISGTERLVLLSADLTTPYRFPKDKYAAYEKAYPYIAPNELFIKKYAFALFYPTLIFLFFYRGRIHRRWFKAKQDDSIIAYKHFNRWAKKGYLKRLNSALLIKKANKKIEHLQLVRMKQLEVVERAWGIRGASIALIPVLKDMINSHCDIIPISINVNFLATPKPAVEGSAATNILAASRQHITPLYTAYDSTHMQWLRKVFQNISTNTVLAELLSKEEAEARLLSLIIESLNQHAQTLIGVAPFTALAEVGDASASQTINFDINAFALQTQDHENKRDSFSGQYFNRNKGESVDNPFCVCGPFLGLTFSCKELGLTQFLPPISLFQASNTKPSLLKVLQYKTPNTALNNAFFDGAALSGVQSMLSKVMGSDGWLPPTVLTPNAKSLAETDQCQKYFRALMADIERECREASLEELAVLSSQELYKNNKADIDAYVSLVLDQHVDPDTAAMVRELYGHALGLAGAEALLAGALTGEE
jgi:hypothetical protein